MAITIKGKDYEVRELTFDDSRAISEIMDLTNFDLKNFEEDLMELKDKRLTKDQLLKAGIGVMGDIIAHLIKNYHKAHKEVGSFLASLIGVTHDEFKKMPITTPVKIIKELSKTVDLKDFLDSVAG